MVQRVKNLCPVRKYWAWSLGQEDPLKKGMATHSSILAWRIPWTEEPGGLQSMGSERVRQDWVRQGRRIYKYEYNWVNTLGCWIMEFLKKNTSSLNSEWKIALVFTCLVSCTSIISSTPNSEWTLNLIYIFLKSDSLLIFKINLKKSKLVPSIFLL